MKFLSNHTTILLKLLVGTSLLTKNVVESHGVELRDCITDEGKLRIFVEHWHPDLTRAGEAGHMEIRDDTDGPNGPISMLLPTGFINNVEDSETGLPGCASGTSNLFKTCSNPKGNWVWFDFETQCEKDVKYVFLQGTTVVLEDGCPQLYLDATITANFQDVTAPVPYLNGERCDNGDGTTKILFHETNSHGDTTAVVDFDVSALDDCDPNPSASTDFPSGYAFPLGNTDVTITAIDNKGHVGNCTFIVHVQDGSQSPSMSPSNLPTQDYSERKCSVFPDPHYQSFGGRGFDFHGGCDTILIKTDVVEIHLRTQRRRPRGWAGIQSIGLKINADILEFKSNPYDNSISNFFINDPTLINPFNTIQDVPEQERYIGGWGPLKSQGNGSVFILSDPIGKGHIEITNNERGWGSYAIAISGFGFTFEEEFKNNVGMCGGFQNDDRNWYNRDGSIVTNLLEYGNEWRVQPSDTQILSDISLDYFTEGHNAYPEKCNLSGVRSRNLKGNKKAIRAAQQNRSLQTSCEFCQNLWDESLIPNCEFDADIMGCENMAAESLYVPEFGNIFQTPPTVENGGITCKNNDDYFFVDDLSPESTNITCNWIRLETERRNEYCQYQAVHVNCPLSCGVCCEDDPSYTFNAPFAEGSKTKDCEWVGKKIIRQQKYCSGEVDESDPFVEFQGGKWIREACPKACNFCVDLVE